MKVRDLILFLSTLDPELDVLVLQPVYDRIDEMPETTDIGTQLLGKGILLKPNLSLEEGDSE